MGASRVARKMRVKKRLILKIKIEGKTMLFLLALQ